MKKRKVSFFMVPYIKEAMEKNGFSYSMCDHNGYIELCSEIPNRKFAVVREDAECILEEERNHTSIPVLSYRTLQHPEKRKKSFFQSNRKAHAFYVLEKDEKKFQESLGFQYNPLTPEELALPIAL